MWFLLTLFFLLSISILIFITPTTRQRFITPYVLAWFKKALPPMHETERVALEAGHVAWEKELFCGNPNWSKLTNITKHTLTSDETAFLNNQVETLCSMLNEWEMVNAQAKDLPQAAWDYLKKEGFFGLQIPKSYGGLGFSVWAHSHVITKIASRSISAAITVMVPNALGPAELLQSFGTAQQKQHYLPRLARGDEIPAFALTSVEAGSDATAMLDTGVICRSLYEGQEIIGIKLNWNKRHITLAPIATLLGLAFKLYDPEHLLGEKTEIGITLALVPTHLSGVEIGKRHAPSGLAFLNGPTEGHDVFVPLDCIIGGAEMAGRGWHILMDGLAQGRGISLPALSTAAAQLCYRMTGAYAKLREQFHLPIGVFEGVAEKLGYIGGLTYLSEATRHFTLGAIAEGLKPSLGAAITKYQLTEMARMIVNDAMDVHAGHAIQLGPHNYLGLLYQAMPIGITVEGANILTRNLIVFGQGALRCHPFVNDEIAASEIADPVLRLQRFDGLFYRHVMYTLKQFGKIIGHGLTGGLLIRVAKQTPFRRHCKQLTRMSTALAFASDLSFAVLNKQLKRKEAISARLGDVLSQLYLASAAIKFYETEGKLKVDLIFAEWALDYCLHAIQTAFDGALFNFSPRWVGYILHRLIFPWGRAYKPVSDQLTRKIATQMMCTSDQRDRLTQYCYVGKTLDDATGRMELALEALEKMQGICEQHQLPVSKSLITQLNQAKKAGIFSEEELKALALFLDLRNKALQVDAF